MRASASQRESRHNIRPSLAHKPRHFGANHIGTVLSGFFAGDMAVGKACAIKLKVWALADLKAPTVAFALAAR
ncbi:hypothetical protein [Rhizobium sp. 2MFCol3.1]|uniref:hypothetical protein n=1 Tax=Rhizobium sp. 2MFCol3.1 TaxID=1246459 RepID=UPI0003A40A0E|nr:hypothetical protein [Rhizobium sp. 2MFCol3.1]